MRIAFPLLSLMVLGIGLRVSAQKAQSGLSVHNGGASTSRHLIICLDGVGYSEIERLKSQGYFKDFNPPSRLISPFPSLTNLSMVQILGPAGASQAEGYEDHYYDNDAAKIRGGLIERFRQDRFIKGTFRQLFDYHPSALKSGLGYALPPLSTYVEALTDVIQMRKGFESSKEPVYLAYVGSTDSLAHLGGRSMLRQVLKRLDAEITRTIAKDPSRIIVSIFSDHGNHFRKYERVSLRKPLARGGYRLVGKLDGPRDVVFPQYGLVGSAALFSSHEEKEGVARTLAGVRGVDVALIQNGMGVKVFGRRGTALVSRDGERFRYLALEGDPLDLLSVLNRLRQLGKVDDDGFVSDRDWFEATIQMERPDVIKRVYEGVNGLVRNKAQVLISFEDGYYTGSFGLDLFSILQATHGNLGKEQSYGFAITTGLALPPDIRASELWPALGTPILKNGNRECTSCESTAHL